MCRTLNYFEHFIIFFSAVTGCVSISSFASSIVVPVGIACSAVRLKICLIIAGIKIYQPIIIEIENAQLCSIVGKN